MVKLLPETGYMRSMRNFSKNYPPSCLKEGDAAYIADIAAEIMGDEGQFKASIEKSFPTCRDHLKPDSKPVQRHTEGTGGIDRRRNRRCLDKLAGLFMEEMISALMTAQKTPKIYKADLQEYYLQHRTVINAVTTSSFAKQLLRKNLEIYSLLGGCELGLAEQYPEKKKQKVLKTQCFQDFLWCGQEDLNLHEIALTRT